MTSTEGDRPEEENPNNNNSNHVRIQSNMIQGGNSGSGVTSGRIVFGPPRPSFDRQMRENTETGQNNNDGRTTTATDNHHNNHSNDGRNRGIPGTSIPMRMRINVNSSSSNGNHNDPASAASAAFAALQHPHVQAAMARHASRSRTVENSTMDNAAGRPQSTTLRYNTPTPQQITVVPAFSSSPMPTAPLPPLQPQPLHFSNSIDTMDIKLANNAVCSKFSNKNNLKAFLKRIECRICFEYMESPVGCPNESCDARFCFSCLHRSVSTTGTQNDNNNSQRLSKCPCCRKEFPSDKFITPDVALKGEIMNCNLTSLCPFPNCQMRVPLIQLKNHEKTCEYVPMRCQYSTVGCTWSGPKRDLSGHLSLGCTYHKVPGLVEQVRKNRMQYVQMMHRFNQQTATMHQMVLEQSQMVTMTQLKNINNIVDMLHLVFTCTCHTYRFLLTGKPIWKPFFHTQISRATVCNFLCLLPWMLWVLKIFSWGLNRALNMNDYIINDAPDSTIELVEDIFLSFSVALIGFLQVACFHVDEGNSLVWTQYRMPSFLSSYIHPMLRDSVALSGIALTFACVGFDANLTKRIVLWLVSTVATVVFPPIVDEILRIASVDTIDTNENTQRQYGRAYATVIFGIKYGLLFSVCDIVPTVDAVLILRLFKRIFHISDNKFILEETDCMISDMDKGHFLSYIAVARISYVLAQLIHKKENLQTFLLETAVVVLIQLLANMAILKLNIIAGKIAKQVAADSIAVSRRSEPKWKLFNGAFCFGIWASCLGCILVS